MPRRKKEIQGIKTRDVNAASRAALALQMALEGHDWKTTAHLSGYASAGAAWNAVQRELQRTIQPLADEVRKMEIARLDRYLTVFDKKAMTGDGWSLDRCLRIMERRAALLGLDARTDASAIAAAQVVIREYPAGVAEAV